MSGVWWTVVLLSLLAFTPSTNGGVLLVSFDGFRWRYLHKYRAETSWFWELKRNGTADKVGGMDGTYVTKTFPSHMTLATGLYQESHGIVSNVMYDPETKQFFNYKNREDNQNPVWWSDGEPIWITAEKQGKKSATFFWPGSETTYGGVMQSIWLQYNHSIDFKTRVDTVVKWLSKDNVQLATLYFHEPDSSGHRFGPNAPQIRKIISSCNAILGYLIQKLREAKIYSSTNLIVISDHGMSECSKSKIIPLFEDIKNRTDLYNFTVNKDGPLLDFFSQKGKAEELYQYLSNVIKTKGYNGTRIYRKSDLPDRLHFKHHRRIADVLMIADEGYYLAAVKNKKMKLVNPRFGCHGFDNAIVNMEPIFIAHGPNISQKSVIPRIKQVDIYNLISTLLGIKPRPNNGSMTRIESIVNKGSRMHLSLISTPCLLIFICVMNFLLEVNSVK